MSIIAGRLSVQFGAACLENTYGGRGILLGGVPGVEPADVVILGAGVAGMNATRIAIGMGAHVTVLDTDIKRLAYLDEAFRGSLCTLLSNTTNVSARVKRADLVIGTVLVAGCKTPRLVTRETVRTMKPGAAIVDVSVDQGGCVETTHPSTLSNPRYVEEGVVHCCIDNMPASVPRTSTFALANATLPYVLAISNKGVEEAVRQEKALAEGVNVYKGHLTCAGVAEAHGFPYTPLKEVL